MEPIESQNLTQPSSLKFTGKGFEYFKIWIVNICLSVVTLGIYSAWAKVRTKSYFYGNTVLNNSSFSYLADPKKILKGRIIAVILFTVYGVAWQYFPEAGITLLVLGCLIFPFFIVSAMSFRMRNTAYRNIRFHFIKDLKAAYMVFLPPLGFVILFTWLSYTLADFFGVIDLTITNSEKEGEVFIKNDFIFVMFLLWFIPILPWLDFLRIRFIVNHTQFGKAKATFAIGGREFYKLYFITVLIYLASFIIPPGVILGMVHGMSMIGFEFDRSILDNEIIRDLGIVVLSFDLFGSYIFLAGIWKAMRTNMLNNNIKIGENQLHSHLKSIRVGWIYLTNTVAIILSLGLLIPWAKIRMARYTASCTELQINDLDSIKAIAPEQETAFGEEMDAIFDLDIGF
jgi:uncharacterized membrane protein YjgN (DUF898 family)